MAWSSMSISALTTSPITSSASSRSMRTSPSPPHVSSVYPPFGPRHPFVGSPPLATSFDAAVHTSTGIPPQPQPQPQLTLQERRVRNKAASAKYRQKKNEQQNEMRRLMYHITEQNAILDRQLQELRTENDRLRKTTDRMRGKVGPRKMLRQWILKEGQSMPSSNHRKDSALYPAGKRQQQGTTGAQDKLGLLYSDDDNEPS